jgi:GNAT superfamily N-acetyltransferase
LADFSSPSDAVPVDQPAHGPWRARAQVAEAIVALIVARLLVATVPLAKWRRALGRRIDGPDLPDPSEDTEPLAANLAARRLARAVGRGAARLPGETRCLARALALHAMLRRRGIGAILLIGVRPRAERGGLDDLHAWVLRNGEVLIGGNETGYVPLVGFAIEALGSPP